MAQTVSERHVRHVHTARIVGLHPAVRLRAPSAVTRSRWVAEHLSARRRFALSTAAAALLIASVRRRPRQALLVDVADRLRVPASTLETLLDSLEARGLLTGDDGEAAWIAELQDRWATYGWHASVDYHLLTYDYEFADYSADGRFIDARRMSSYSRLEPDIERAKSYPGALRRLSVPGPDAALVPTPFERVWRRRVPPRVLTAHTLSAVIAMTFGKTGELMLRWPGSRPAIRKTSPSGGARHPTEAYVVVRRVPDLPEGWYHYAVETSELELLREGVDQSELKTLFFGAYTRAPFPVAAIVVLTSVFDRNMYRYREPRTFRAVHLDVGHLTTSLEVFAAALGVPSFAHYGLDDEGVEGKLDINGLREGAMLAVALGGVPTGGGDDAA